MYSSLGRRYRGDDDDEEEEEVGGEIGLTLEDEGPNPYAPSGGGELPSPVSQEYGEPEEAPEPAPTSGSTTLPVGEEGQPWQTSAFNALKNFGGGVQEKLQGAANLPGVGGALQAASTFPSAVTGLLGLPAMASSENARKAYAENHRTLEGGDPGFFDFPSVSRGLNAAREARADESRVAAEDESNPGGRMEGLIGQGIYGALPNVMPAAMVPKGIVKPIAQGTSATARLAAQRVKHELTPAERPVGAGQTRLYRGEDVNTGRGPEALGATHLDPEMRIPDDGPGGTRSFAGGVNGREVADFYKMQMEEFPGGRAHGVTFDDITPEKMDYISKGTAGRVRSLDLGADEAAQYQAGKFITGADEFEVPTNIADRRGPIPMERPIITKLKAFNADQEGTSPALNKLIEKFGQEKGTQIYEASKAFAPEQTVEEIAAPAATKSVPRHMDPATVGPEVAARNTAVHSANEGLIDSIRRWQAGDAAAEAEVKQFVTTLQQHGVSPSNTLAKLKQAGISGLPGTTAPIARAPLAARIGGETPPTEAAPALANQPLGKRIVNRSAEQQAAQQGQGAAKVAQEARAPGSVMATTPAQLKATVQTKADAGQVPTLKAKARAQLVAEARERLAAAPPASLRFGMDETPAGPVLPPLKASVDRVSEVSAQAHPQARGSQKLNLMTDPNISTEEFMRLRAAGQTEAPVGAPVNAKPRTSTKLTHVPKPKTTTTTPPPPLAAAGTVPTAGSAAATPPLPIVGKGKSGRVGLKATATAGPLYQKSPPMTAVGGGTASSIQAKPMSPAQQAPAVVSASTKPIPAAAAPAQANPAVPASGSVARVQAAAAKVGVPIKKTSTTPQSGFAGSGTPTTGTPAAKGKRTTGPVTLNPNTFMYEARVGGKVVGVGATHAQAVKAAQAHVAAGGSGGGAGGAAPGTATGAGGPTPPGGAGGKIGTGPTKPPTQDIISEVLNAPRTAQTIGDISYTLRQGFVLGAGHPKEAAKAFGKVANYLVHVIKRDGEGYATKQMSRLQNTPEFKRMKDLDLELTSWDATLGPLEEGFLSSRLAGLPIARQSNVAGVMFLNEMRYAVGKQVLNGAKNASDDQLKATMRFINAATGRGNFHKRMSQQTLDRLNGLFYSPRLQLSRYEVVSALPYAAIKKNPVLAKEAARDIVASFVAGQSMLQLAKMGGLQVEERDTHPNWGKIQVGNTHIDLWGSFQPYARLVNQTIKGERTTIGDKVILLDNFGMPKDVQKSQFSQLMDRYRAPSDLGEFLTKSIHGKFVRSKLAPVPGLAVSALLGKNYAGEKFDFATEAKQSLTPLGWQDLYEAVMDDLANGGSGAQGAAVGTLGLLGAGIQTINKDGKKYPLLADAAWGAATGGISLLKGDNGRKGMEKFQYFPEGYGKETGPAPKATKKPAPTKYNPYAPVGR